MESLFSCVFWGGQGREAAEEGVAVAGGYSVRSEHGVAFAPSRSGLHSLCVLLRLAAWPLCLGMPVAGSRLEGGLIFPGFDVLIPQRSCSLRLRSAAASQLRFPHLPLRCQVRLRPRLGEETCPSLNLTVWVQRSPDGAAGARGAGAAALSLGCLCHSRSRP